MRLRAVVVLVAILVSSPIPCGGVCVRVPQDQPTIQAGIYAAAYGDTVAIAAGTYYERDIVMRSGVWVRSADGDPASVTVDGASAGRLFFFDDVQEPCGLEGITVARGFHAQGGGGALIRDASATILNCIFLQNRAVHPSIHLGVGGALLLSRSTVSVRGCAFTNNAAGLRAGAISGSVSDIVVQDCTFTANTASEEGGVARWAGGHLTFEDCAFRGNSAIYGGAIHILGSDNALVVRRCAFYENTAESQGGALYMYRPQSLLVEDSVLWGNCAGQYGSAAHLYLGGSVFSFTRCTIAGNGSPLGECALTVGEGVVVTLENSIVAFNRSVSPILCMSNGAATLTCCDVHGNTGSNWSGCIASQLGLDGNFSANPLFCDFEEADLALYGQSPCTPTLSPCGELVGALGAGCSTSGLQPLSWGCLKALYR